MKKILFLSILAGLSCMTTFADDWANLARYKQVNKVVAKQDASKRKIVMMGNSITDNWASMDTAFFVKNGIIGRGISGQVTKQMLERFCQDVVALAPQKVVILCGTNDIAENDGKYTEDVTLGNITKMAQIALDNGIEPILCSVLPVEYYFWRKDIKDVPAKILSLNSRISAFAKSRNLKYINYYPAMLAPDGVALNPRYTKDGVHPTISGYHLMEQIFLNAVK